MPWLLLGVLLLSALDFRNEVLDSFLQTWGGETDLLGKCVLLLRPVFKRRHFCLRGC